MTTLRRSVSSLGALVTFEAAARLESFTQAASELGVTQGGSAARSSSWSTTWERPCSSGGTGA